MFNVQSYSNDRSEAYELLFKQLDALLEGEKNITANLANAAALLNQFLDRINWAGFYLMEESSSQLVLGPFQGLPACVRIPIGRGVCGKAAQDKETVVVDDVHQFPGHIACDAASQSEIVVPMVKDGVLIGVLDIDSPEKSRFDSVDKENLETFVSVLLKHL
ncbi:GAF domain-containing protein [Fictibacillus iocasae]|uniref:GAF domain-containing protein n=1 Tax=Fictibacillus iocasae TaxID=2715437 RepID=A0ABW2NZJ1_9BACL